MHSRLDRRAGLGEAGCFQRQPRGGGGALQVFVVPVGLIIDF